MVVGEGYTGVPFVLIFVEVGSQCCWRYTLCSLTVPRATQLHSFMDYVKGGCEVSLLVAIDFTVSVP